MKKHFFRPLSACFRCNWTTSSKSQKRSILRFEPLEERQMLSVTPPCLENQTIENPPVEFASPLFTESFVNLSSFERNVTDSELSSNFSSESVAPIAMVAEGEVGILQGVSNELVLDNPPIPTDPLGIHGNNYTNRVYTGDSSYHGVGNPIIFTISLGEIGTREIDTSKKAKIVLSVHDVDFLQGEIDRVSINGVVVGYLDGANQSWSVPSFEFDASILKTGDNIIRIDPSVEASGWVVRCDWGQITCPIKSVDFKIEKESIVFSPTTGEKKPFQDTEDAFIGEKTTLKATLLPDGDKKTFTEKDKESITSVQWKVEKKVFDETGSSVIEFKQIGLTKKAKTDIEVIEGGKKIQLSFDGWTPEEGEHGYYQITCTVQYKSSNDKVITLTDVNDKSVNKYADGTKKDLRVGVMKYDVSFARALVDENTGGVILEKDSNGNYKFDTTIANINGSSLVVDRKWYEDTWSNASPASKFALLLKQLKDKDILKLSTVEVKKKGNEWVATSTGMVSGCSPEMNSGTGNGIGISFTYKEKTKTADQVKLLDDLYKTFSDYHLFVLFGSEGKNGKYIDDGNGNGKIYDTKTNIKEALYLPSLAQEESYDTDAEIEVMARTIAYVDWQNYNEDNIAQPGSLVIYAKWHEDSSTPVFFSNVSGTGEIVLTPYVVAFAETTNNNIDDFQGYGLVNGLKDAKTNDDYFFISRGTEKPTQGVQKFSDWATDLRNEGVGKTQYDNAKGNVFNWISKLPNNVRSLTLTGHSLGGSLTQWFAAGCTNRGFESKLKKVVTFNGTGINKTDADAFNARISSKVQISHYISNGDVISLAGEAFIGKNIESTKVYIVSYQTNISEGLGIPRIVRNGYKHGMWLADNEARKAYEGKYLLKTYQYTEGSSVKISIEDLNSYWFHYTQDRYLFAISLFNQPSELNESLTRGTTEQARKAAPWIRTSRNEFVAFDSNSNGIQDSDEWKLYKINQDVEENTENGYYYCFANDYLANDDNNSRPAKLDTLSGMTIDVNLLYDYDNKIYPNEAREFLLTELALGTVKKGTKLGGCFALRNDTTFVFDKGLNSTYTNMTNETVSIKTGTIELRHYVSYNTPQSLIREDACVDLFGKYTEKVGDSVLELNGISFRNCSGSGLSPSSITVDSTAGKKVNFVYTVGKEQQPLSVKATATDLDMTIVFEEQTLSLTKATLEISNRNATIEGEGTMMNNKVKVKLSFIGSSEKASQWKVSYIQDSNDTIPYEYENGKWQKPEPKTVLNSNWGIGIAASLPMRASALESEVPLVMASQEESTYLLAFNWTNETNDPELLFMVNNTIYSEAEMINLGYITLNSDGCTATSRSYYTTESESAIHTWRFDSNVDLGSVSIALYDVTESLKVATVTDVSVSIEDGSLSTIEMEADHVDEDTMFRFVLRSATDTETDVHTFWALKSDTVLNGTKYQYEFDFTGMDIPTGEYVLYAYTDETDVDNAVVSSSFTLSIEADLSINTTTLAFVDAHIGTVGSETKTATITNNGNGIAHYTISGKEEGDWGAFSLSGEYSNGEELNSLSFILLPGESVDLNITFVPNSVGNKAIELDIIDSISNTTKFTISATGVALGMLPTDITTNDTNATISASSVTPGDPLDVSFFIKNAGDKVSDYITVTLYASVDANDLVSGQPLASYSYFTLDEDTEEEIAFSLSSFPELAAGNYHIGWVVECENDSDASNNSAVMSETLEVLAVVDNTFTGVSATPVDTNANGLYDKLNISATINVETAGDYTIYYTLRDSNSEQVTSTYKTVTLAAGDNTVTIAFDGNDIFQSGLNGPYSLNVGISDANFSYDKSGVFQTSAYTFNQFEGAQAVFASVYSDSGTDTDDDGKFNALIINTDVNVTVAGTYKVSGTLVNADGDFVAFDSTDDLVLSVGSHTIPLKFDSLDIISNSQGGPFTLTHLRIEDVTQDTILSKVENAHTTETGKYTLTDFDSEGTLFTGANTSFVTDSDSNGLYNSLTFRAGVSVQTAGDYYLTALVTDKDSQSIKQVNQFCSLYANSNAIDVVIDGLVINQGNFDGPYGIFGIQLLNEDGETIANGTSFVTDTYSHTDFEHQLLTLAGDITDSLNESNTSLDVTFTATSENGGYYNANARIVDSEGNTICWTATNITLEANTATPITLNFDYTKVIENGVSGPFFVKDFSIYNNNTGAENDSVFITDFHETAPYSIVLNVPEWNLADYNYQSFKLDTNTNANYTATLYGLESDGSYTLLKAWDFIGVDAKATLTGQTKVAENLLITSDAMELLGEIIFNGGTAARDTVVIEGTANDDLFTIDSKVVTTTQPVYTTNPYANIIARYSARFGEESKVFKNIKAKYDKAFARLQSVVKTTRATFGTMELDGGAEVNFTGAKDVVVSSDAGNDTFKIDSLSTNYTLNGNAGSDNLDFSDSDRRVVIDMGSTAKQHALPGDSGTIRLVGNFGSITGSPNADRITGSDSGVSVYGNGGRDTVILNGTDGVDNYVALTGDHQSVIIRGSGDNTINLTDSDYSVINAAATTEAAGLTIERANGRNLTVLGGRSSVYARNVSGDYITFNCTATQVADLVVTGDHATILTGKGNDYVYLEGNNGKIDTNAGNDQLVYSGSRGNLFGGAGDDTIDVNDLVVNNVRFAGNNRVYGEAGNDRIFAALASGTNYFYGGAGNDIIVGTSGNDYIYGNAGDNILIGLDGVDRVYGAGGRDVLVASRTSNMAGLETWSPQARENLYSQLYAAWVNNEGAAAQTAVSAILGDESTADGDKDWLYRGGGKFDLFYANLGAPDNDYENALGNRPFFDVLID